MSSSWWDGENNTIYNLSSNHCFAYRGGMGCISLWLWCCDLMTVHQFWTDEEPLGFDMVVKTFLSVTYTINICVLIAVCAEKDGDTLIYFSVFSLLSLCVSPFPSLSSHSMMLEVLQAWNSISQPLNRQQLHWANSIVKIVQWSFLNRLRPQL